MKSILVWDWPTRLGHWLLVGAFALAWLTSESDALIKLHGAAGVVATAIVAYRLVWGLIGSRHARFAAFVRGPAAVVNYLRALLGTQPEHHTGHNPAGGWAVVAMLVLALLTGFSGWATYEEWGGHWLEELHEGLAATWLTLVVVHVGGVIVSGWRHGENLPRAMVSGYKQGQQEEAIPSARPLAAVILLAWVGATCAWWLA